MNVCVSLSICLVFHVRWKSISISCMETWLRAHSRALRHAAALETVSWSTCVEVWSAICLPAVWALAACAMQLLVSVRIYSPQNKFISFYVFTISVVEYDSSFTRAIFWNLFFSRLFSFAYALDWIGISNKLNLLPQDGILVNRWPGRSLRMARCTFSMSTVISAHTMTPSSCPPASTSCVPTHLVLWFVCGLLTQCNYLFFYSANAHRNVLWKPVIIQDLMLLSTLNLSLL